MALEKELATYKRELPQLLEHEGQFVVIKGDKIIGIWETYGDALQDGYRAIGLESFLVKKIAAVEPTYHVSRDIKPPCRS